MPTTLARPTFSLNPMLWLAVSFTAGIVLAQFVEIPLSITVAAIVVLSIAAAVLRGHWVSTVIVLFLFAIAGAMCMGVETATVSPDRLKRLYEKGVVVSGDPVEIEGILFGEPEPAPEGYFLKIEAGELRFMGQAHQVSGRARFFLPLATDETRADFSVIGLRHGSRVRVATRLEREDRFLNPGVMMRTQMLDRQGIDATGTVKSPLLIEYIGRESVFIPLASAFELRKITIERFRETFSPTAAGILIASTFGNKYFLDKRTADIFREGGTFHVLVISGLHITFIGVFILLIVRIFTKRRSIQAAIVLAIMWLYGIAVGADPPVIRACVMFTILMAGYASYRTSTLLNSLGACVLILLVWKPSDLFEPSFQLTVASVAGIICIALPLLTKLRSIGEWMPSGAEPFPPNVPAWLRRFCETIYWRPAAWTIEQKRNIWSARIIKRPFADRIDDLGIRRLLIFIFEGIIISIAVQLALLPLTIVYFHRVSFASILLNLWVGPLLAAESIAALIAVIVRPFSYFASIPFVAITETLNWLLVTAPSVLTDSGWASFRVPIYSDSMYAIYIIYFLPIAALAYFIVRWNPFELRKSDLQRQIASIFAAGLMTTLALILVFHPSSSPRPDGLFHIEFLDVGQGDSTLITFPNGETMLVDAGGRMNYSDDETFEPDVPRIGEAVVSEFLWERGISRVDHLVATHADADHIQGLVDITKNFSVGRAYFGRMESDDLDLNELIAAVDRSGIPKTLVDDGTTLEVGGIRLDVLNPSRVARLSANNDSIVLRLTYGEISILLTGDIEREAEQRILMSGAELNSMLLKVPHHGSRTSSTEAFANAVKPRLAVISVGKRSQFGHPHADIVDRWKSTGAKVMTTGESGTIFISTDGKTLDVKQFVN